MAAVNKEVDRSVLGPEHVYTVPGAHGTHHVTAITGLPGDGAVVSGSVKGGLKVWHAATCHPLQEYTAHVGAINALATGRDGCFSASSDRTVKVYYIYIYIYIHI